MTPDKTPKMIHPRKKTETTSNLSEIIPPSLPQNKPVPTQTAQPKKKSSPFSSPKDLAAETCRVIELLPNHPQYEGLVHPTTLDLCAVKKSRNKRPDTM